MGDVVAALVVFVTTVTVMIEVVVAGWNGILLDEWVCYCCCCYYYDGSDCYDHFLDVSVDGGCCSFVSVFPHLPSAALQPYRTTYGQQS